MEQNTRIGTHTVTAPNAKPPLELDAFKVQLHKEYAKHINNYFRNDKKKAMRFMTSVIHSAQKLPQLLSCDRESLMNAFMTCAEYELYPSNASGEAYVLPYNGKQGLRAQFQLGYQGIITLLYRAGVESISANIVYKNDSFEFSEGLSAKLTHNFNPFASADERGEAIGVYAIATVNGQKMFKVMSKEEIMKYREFSQAKASAFSPWNSDKDPDRWMWKKTCIKQLAKLLPKNDAMMRAIATDNEEGGASAPQLDAAGPAVGRADHEPESHNNANGTDTATAGQ